MPRDPLPTHIARWNAYWDYGWPAALTKTEGDVWGAYHRFANRDGVAWPSATTIADNLGHKHPSHVREARKKLIARGLLERVTTGGRRGEKRRASEFRIVIPNWSPQLAAAPRPESVRDPVRNRDGLPRPESVRDPVRNRDVQQRTEQAIKTSERTDGGKAAAAERGRAASLAAEERADDTPIPLTSDDAVLALVQDPGEFKPADARRLVAKHGPEQVRIAIANADILQRRGTLRRRRQYIATAISDRYDPIPEDDRPAPGPTPETLAEAERQRRAQNQAERDQLDADRRETDRLLATLSDAQWKEHVAAIEDGLTAKARRDLAAGVHPRNQRLVCAVVAGRLRELQHAS